MSYRIVNVTAWPDIAPILSIEEARAHLRVLDTGEDALIAAMVLSAMDQIERHTSHVLTPREMEMQIDRFPRCEELLIPREPISDVISLSYEDEGGAEVAINDFRWSAAAADQLRPAWNGIWPTTGRRVRVRFEAGYEDGMAPPALILAVKLLLGDFYNRRENAVLGQTVAELPIGVDSLCRSYRRWAV